MDRNLEGLKEKLNYYPKSDIEWVNFGELLRKHKFYAEAEISFLKSIQINPKSYCAWNNLGNLLKRLKRFEEAEEAYRNADKLKAKEIENSKTVGTRMINGKNIASQIHPTKYAVIMNQPTKTLSIIEFNSTSGLLNDVLTKYGHNASICHILDNKPTDEEIKTIQKKLIN